MTNVSQKYAELDSELTPHTATYAAILPPATSFEEPNPPDSSTLSQLEEIARRYGVEEAFESCQKLKHGHTLQHEKHELSNTAHNHLVERPSCGRNLLNVNVAGDRKCPLGTASSRTENLDRAIADPIDADHRGEGSLFSVDASSSQQANKCPIRFLDQHSPEEVATYFENHKHEIPRSHTLCVSRFRQNEAKIRQLDSRYRNLQDMITRLGEQHQRYLPSGDADNGTNKFHRPFSHSQCEAVEQWMGDIGQEAHIAEKTPSSSPQLVSTPTGNDDMECGTEQADDGVPGGQSLRDIRLGESPSRPWGISVPIHRPAHEHIQPLSLEQ